MNHHVGNFELAKTENVLDVFGLDFLKLAVLGGGLDQSLDFGIRQNLLLRSLSDAKQT